jgi:hypothetical protein
VGIRLIKRAEVAKAYAQNKKFAFSHTILPMSMGTRNPMMNSKLLQVRMNMQNSTPNLIISI